MISILPLDERTSSATSLAVNSFKIEIDKNFFYKNFKMTLFLTVFFFSSQPPSLRSLPRLHSSILSNQGKENNLLLMGFISLRNIRDLFEDLTKVDLEM